MITGPPDAEPAGTDADPVDAGTGAGSPAPAVSGPARPGQRRPGPAPLLRLRWALVTALASGLLLAAAFAPIAFWPFAVLSPALLVVVLHGRSLRTSFAVGLVFGLAFFFPLLAWVINLAWFAWVALAIASALIFAVFTVAQRLLLNLRGWPLAVAGWWVAAEAFRDRWPWGGFPWGRLAMSQAGLPTQGWAAIGGAPLLSFAVGLTGTVLAWVLISAVAARAGVRARRWRTTVVAAAAFAVTAGVSCLPAALPLDPVPAHAKTTEVAAIQGNVPRARSLQAQLDELQVTLNHATATEKLAAEVAAGRAAKPDLVIWPENSTDIDPTQYPPIYQEIAHAASAIGRPILVGAVLQNPERNAGVLWLPGRGPTTLYVKRRLVPFGEYIPFRSVISKITSLTQLQPTDFVPGDKTVVFQVGQVRLGDVICYEIAFDDLVRSEVAAGANLLTMQSNDATFERDGQTGESGQQLAMARIRAVEFDRSVVVASTTGYSAIIAPDGHLITSSGVWQQAELEARVPLLTSATLAERAGAWPEWAIVAATALALLLAAVRLRAARRADKLGARQGRDLSTVNGRHRIAVGALTVAAALLATACQASSPAATKLDPSAVASKPAAVTAKYLKISPAPGTKDANPAAGITVTAGNGAKIDGVTVKTTGAHPVAGQLSASGASWHSTYALPTGQSYTVTATGTDGSGHPVSQTSKFTTLTPTTAFHTEIYEGAGATYGVGMPIMLTFDQPIKDKAAVERALTVTTSQPVVGAWYWDGDEKLDFRPRDYWPANTRVSFSSHLDGVEGAPGVYGVHDLTQTFSIGQSVIAVADTVSHKTQVYVGGKLAYDWPISTGRTTLPTPDGTYLTVEKANPVRMVGGGKKGSPGYYNELVNWAVRFTYSGDYYHSAPWSVVNQGTSNVSHGCVNLAPEDAKIYYDMAIPGDPVTITGSPKAGNWDDGWTPWFLSWSQYLAGSATHRAVEAGPRGSTLVKPSALPADGGAAPLSTSVPGNYAAA